MHPIIIASIPLLSLLAVSAAAGGGGGGGGGDDVFRRGGASAAPRDDVCSPWNSVASDLMAIFLDDEGACTDDARAAIRTSFHDCFPEACDGSLILSADECSRSENTQMSGICSTLSDKAASAAVSGADMVQLAAALGIAVCKGPSVGFLVGRQSTSEANPAGQMPSPAVDAATMVQLWADRGFTASELVALTGAHTVAKTLNLDPLDSSVSQWDSSFYTETANGAAPASIPSDVKLVSGADTAASWSSFGADQGGWDTAFISAFGKMSTMGNDISTLSDCSSVVTSTVSSNAKLRRRRLRTMKMMQ